MQQEPKVVGYVAVNGNTYQNEQDAKKYGGGLVSIRKVFAPVVEVVENTEKYESQPTATGNIDVQPAGDLDRNAAFGELSWPELKKLAQEHGMENVNKANKAEVLEFLKKSVAN